MAMKNYFSETFTQSDQTSLDFDGSEFVRCSFNDCDFRGLTILRCSFPKTVFKNCVFAGMELAGINFRKSTLWDCDFSGANLRSARFHRAGIEDSIFVNADLRGADLNILFASGADFTGANIEGADFRIVPEEFEDSTPSIPINLLRAKGLDALTPNSKPTLAAIIDHSLDTILQLEYYNAAERDQYLSLALPLARSVGIAETLYASDAIPKELLRVSQTIDDEILALLKKRPELVHDFPPSLYEELIAEILLHHGWDVQVTAKTRDGGYDILAFTKELIGGVRSSWIIECKRWSPARKVGVEIVRSLYGLRGELQHAGAIVATTSTFSADAAKYSASRYNLHLADFAKINEWLRDMAPMRTGARF